MGIIRSKRMDAATISDTVNTASRIESLDQALRSVDLVEWRQPITDLLIPVFWGTGKRKREPLGFTSASTAIPPC